MKTEEKTLEWLRERRNSNTRTRFIDIRKSLGSPDHPASEYSACTFMKANDLNLRKATLKTTIPVSEINILTNKFLTSCAHVNKLFDLDASQIVQLDEICTSLNGYMHCPATYVHDARDKEDCTIVETCDLDDEKKICTGVHFLSGVAIPPILIFKGALGKAPTEDCAAGGRACLRLFAPKATMTSELMVRFILPHITAHNPKTRVLILDRATSHTTEAVEQSIRDCGIMMISIPAKCTSVLQALDVYYFNFYRRTHNRLVSEATNFRGCKTYVGMTASEKRNLISTIIAEAAHLVRNRLNVEDIFTKLGYLKPSTESVKLRNLPQFVFEEPSEADYASFLERLRKISDTTETDVVEAVRAVCAVPISEKSGPRKRGRPCKQPPSSQSTLQHGPLDRYLQRKDSCTPVKQQCEVLL